VSVPPECGVGKGKMTFSFAQWKEGGVEQAEVDVIISE
jgi:hypothetical protein